jgi:hypothetical protein
MSDKVYEAMTIDEMGVGELIHTMLLEFVPSHNQDDKNTYMQSNEYYRASERLNEMFAGVTGK